MGRKKTRTNPHLQAQSGKDSISIDGFDQVLDDPEIACLIGRLANSCPDLLYWSFRVREGDEGQHIVIGYLAGISSAYFRVTGPSPAAAVRIALSTAQSMIQEWRPYAPALQP